MYMYVNNCKVDHLLHVAYLIVMTDCGTNRKVSERIMGWVERFQTLILLLAVAIGIIIGQVQGVQVYAEFLIMPFLILLFYGMFLSISLGNIRESFANTRFVGTSVLINFVWTPLLVWGLGWVFLSDHPYLWLGFFMLMVTPCTDWYIIFTGMCKGNINQSIAILPLNLILQLALLPIYLYFFTGVIGTFDYAEIIKSIILVLIIPMVAAITTRKLFYSMGKASIIEERVIPFFNRANLIFLCLAIAAMFASQGNLLLQNMGILAMLFMPVILFFVINLFVGEGIGKVMKFSRADTISLDFTILARNSPVALAIAVMAFPEEPLVALALIIGPLLELPLLAIVSRVLLKIRSLEVKEQEHGM